MNSTPCFYMRSYPVLSIPVLIRICGTHNRQVNILDSEKNRVTRNRVTDTGGVKTKSC